MKSPLRHAALAAVGIFCAWALVQWVYIPWSCMRRIAALGNSTALADGLTDEARAAVIARENLARARALEARCPASPQLHLAIAANEQILGHDEEAVQTYRRALAITDRAEIHFAIGVLLTKMGRVDEAVQELATAVRYRRSLLETLEKDAPEMHRRVMVSLRRTRQARPPR